MAEVDDILPSFEVDNFLMSGGVTTPSSPPMYSETNSMTDSVTISSGEQLSLNTTSSTTVSDAHLPAAPSNIWKHLYMMPEVKAPVSISIRITKSFPQQSVAPEHEHPLREYTSSEYVYGYVTVKNNSDKSVKFDSFFVTFEGHSKVGSKTMTFLRTIDPRGSWTNDKSMLQLYHGVKCNLYDEIDKSIYGLPDDKMLQPKQDYKKFFSFRFPEYLVMDLPYSTGETDQHMLPPPTIGFPITTDVQINQALGYGRLAEIGSPFKFHDMSPGGSAVYYTVNARLFGKYENGKGNNIMQQKDFHLKYVPATPMRYIPTADNKLNIVLDHEKFWKEDSWTQFHKIEKNIRRQVEELQEKHALWKLKVVDLKGVDELLLDGTAVAHKKQQQLYVEDKKTLNQYTSIQSSTINAALVPKKLFGHSQSSESVICIAPNIPGSMYNPAGQLFFKYARPKNFSIEMLNFQGATGLPFSGGLPFDFEYTTSKPDAMPPKIETLQVRLLVFTSTVEQPACMEFDSLFAGMPFDKLKWMKSRFREYTNILKHITNDLAEESHEVRARLCPKSYLMRQCQSFESVNFFHRPMQLYKHKNLNVSWKRNQTGSYTGYCEIPSVLKSIEKLHKEIPGLNLVPSFQSFFISRTYALEVSFKFAGYKNNETLLIPTDFLR